MRKFLPFMVVGILILSGFGAVALNRDIEKLDLETFDLRKEINGTENIFTIMT